MSSFNLPARYQSYLGANFFQRQINSLTDALPGVIKRGLSSTPTAPAPVNPGLPDMTGVDKPKDNTMLYAGLGVGGLLVMALLLGKKRRGATAPAAA